MKYKILSWIIVLIVLSSLTLALDLNNLVSYHAFDTASLGTDSHDSVTGSVTSVDQNTTSYVLGSSSAQSDNGGSDKITFSPLKFANNAQSNFTISFWWYADQFVHGDSLFEGMDAGANDNIRIMNSNANGTNAIMTYVRQGDAGTSVAYPVANYGSWQHYVLAYDNLNNIGRIYLNGTLINSFSNDDTIDPITQYRMFNDKNDDNAFLGNIDELSIFNDTLTQSEVTELYNNGAGLPYPFTGLTINITSPINGSGINNTVDFIYNVSTVGSGITLDNCSLYGNFSGAWAINQTNTTILNNTNNTFTIQNLSNGQYIWNVLCNNLVWSPNNFTFFVDTVNPTITPHGTLGSNKLVVFDGTLVTTINYTDERDIYSILVNINGNVTHNLTNLNITAYELNISYDNVNSSVTQSFFTEVCDSHTKSSIPPIEYDTIDRGIKFIDEDRLFFEDDYVKIYPKNNLGYNDAETEYLKDRQNFIFNKKSLPSISETFIVESSHYIDIIQNNYYKGHLVIPDLKRWVDFENHEATKYIITRINNNKVEVTVYGLKSNKITFDSIGSLNCVNATYYYMNLNPSQIFTSNIFVGDNETINLTVTRNTTIMSQINATLYWNNTPFFISSSENFTYNLSVPGISGATSVIPFYWYVGGDGFFYNLSGQTQTINNFFMGVCNKDVNGSTAINFSFYNEDNLTPIKQNIAGTFNYISAGILKSFTVSETSTNNISICISPNSSSYTGNYSFTYSSSEYPQRRYLQNGVTFNNVTQNISVYNVFTSDGIFVRFQIVNVFNSPLTGAIATMEKTISSILQVAEKEISDSSGLTTFWVNPDTEYKFTFERTSCTTQTATLRPTSSEIYIITMVCQDTTVTSNQSYSTGISYDFYPDGSIINNSVYTFNFSLSSSYWEITSCSFDLLDQDNNILLQNSSSFSTTSCIQTLDLNTSNYTRIKALGKYSLNGSLIEVSRIYQVNNFVQGNYSLMTVLDDITNFGENGFDDFTRIFISFLIIIGITLLVSFNLEVHDSESLIMLALLLTWICSYVGWMQLSFYDNATHIIGYQFLKKYMIALILTIIGGSFIIKKEI